MLAWALFPQRGNTDWWKKYRHCQNLGRDGFDEKWNDIITALSPSPPAEAEAEAEATDATDGRP
jgi:hypothetical protein